MNNNIITSGEPGNYFIQHFCMHSKLFRLHNFCAHWMVIYWVANDDFWIATNTFCSAMQGPSWITFRMAPPLFPSFLQKGISLWGKLDTILFHIEWKSGGAIRKLFPIYKLCSHCSICCNDLYSQMTVDIVYYKRHNQVYMNPHICMASDIPPAPKNGWQFVKCDTIHRVVLY